MMRLAILCLIVFPLAVKAQEADFGAWYQYFGNQSFHEKWNWHNEFQYRNFNMAGDLEQLLFRTGVGYNLSDKNNNILLGYVFVYGEPYISGTNEKTTSREHRIFQQYLTRQNFGRFYLTHRYRIEERFLGSDFKVRFRYGFGLQIPINKPTMDKNTIFLSLGNEIFLHAQSPVFDRDRIFGALGFVLSKNIRLETGYMVQLLEKTHRGQVVLGVYNNTPFHRLQDN